MTPLARAVAIYLTELGALNFSSVASGGDTFLYTLPDKPDVAVAIYTTPGVGPVEWSNGLERPGLQIRARGGPSDAVSPLLRLTQIRYHLHRLHNANLPGLRVRQIRATQSDGSALGADAAKRFTFIQNYLALVTSPELTVGAG